MKLKLSTLDSPLGRLLLVTDAKAQVRALDFADHPDHLRRVLSEQYGNYALTRAHAPKSIATGIRDYFDGDLVALEQVPIATVGNPLEQKVWAELRRVPPGETVCFRDLTRALGYEWDAPIAVHIGTAHGANPIAIIVPCHRVIGEEGDLKGYAWGLHRKHWLLRHEGALLLAQAPRVHSESREETGPGTFDS